MNENKNINNTNIIINIIRITNIKDLQSNDAFFLEVVGLADLGKGAAAEDVAGEVAAVEELRDGALAVHDLAGLQLRDGLVLVWRGRCCCRGRGRTRDRRGHGDAGLAAARVAQARQQRAKRDLRAHELRALARALALALVRARHRRLSHLPCSCKIPLLFTLLFFIARR